MTSTLGRFLVVAVACLSVLAGCKTAGQPSSQTLDAGAAEGSPLSAKGKQEALWFQVSAQPYAELPSFREPSASDVASVANPEFNSRTFVQPEDVIPDGRGKVIHSFGAVATVAFEADPNAQTSYTGILKNGAPFGMARLSLATKAVKKTIGSQNFTPGMGLKFFLDGSGHPSVNLLVMYKLDGQSSFNFFANSFSNILPPGEGPAQVAGTVAFAAGLASRGLSPHPGQLTVEHLSRWNADGSKVAESEARAPVRLTFVPTETATASMSASTAETDFRAMVMEQVKSGTVIYDVWASDDPQPHGPFGTRIGVLRTTSGFVASEFADRLLHFQHFTKPSATVTAAGNVAGQVLAPPAAVLDKVLPSTNAQGGVLPGTAEAVTTVLTNPDNSQGESAYWNAADGKSFAKTIACSYSKVNVLHSKVENARKHFCNGERTGFAKTGQDACIQKCKKATPVGQDCLQGCYDWMTSFCSGGEGC